MEEDLFVARCRCLQCFALPQKCKIFVGVFFFFSEKYNIRYDICIIVWAFIISHACQLFGSVKFVSAHIEAIRLQIPTAPVESISNIIWNMHKSYQLKACCKTLYYHIWKTMCTTSICSLAHPSLRKIRLCCWYIDVGVEIKEHQCVDVCSVSRTFCLLCKSTKWE
jgi:hypothetical protein